MATEGDKNVKPVAESKKPAPEVKKAEPDGKKPDAAIKPQVPREGSAPVEDRPAPRDEPSLGKVIAAARERRGLSEGDAARDARIPAHYVRMIESDDYTSISDQLYLLPFLRRYATFLGLDPEEVASRFVRDVQRADMNATRMSEPIQMIEPGGNSTTVRIVVIAAIVAAVIALGWLGYRRLHRPRTVASSAMEPAQFIPSDKS